MIDLLQLAGDSAAIVAAGAAAWSSITRRLERIERRIDHLEDLLYDGFHQSRHSRNDDETTS